MAALTFAGNECVKNQKWVSDSHSFSEFSLFPAHHVEE